MLGTSKTTATELLSHSEDLPSRSSLLYLPLILQLSRFVLPSSTRLELVIMNVSMREVSTDKRIRRTNKMERENETGDDKSVITLRDGGGGSSGSGAEISKRLLRNLSKCHVKISAVVHIAENIGRVGMTLQAPELESDISVVLAATQRVDVGERRIEKISWECGATGATRSEAYVTNIQ
jgi:hypothetical protein